MKKKLAKLLKNKQTLCIVGARCSFVLLVVSLVFQVVVTNAYATKGNEMVTFQKRSETLGKDISLLNLELAQASSMSRIEDSAKKLGFVEYKDPIAVISSSKFAAVSEY